MALAAAVGWGLGRWLPVSLAVRDHARELVGAPAGGLGSSWPVGGGRWASAAGLAALLATAVLAAL